MELKMKENTQIMNRTFNDCETGLIVKNNYLAQSGFNYLTGVREFGKLRIVEGVSKGTASMLLISVMVFDQHNVLIYDAEIPRMTSYSREKVRQLVLEGMISMLRESCEVNGKCFDELQAYEMLDKKLKLVYFRESYEAAINWADEIGIELFNAEEVI
jgi:hypothetical protein